MELKIAQEGKTRISLWSIALAFIFSTSWIELDISVKITNRIGSVAVGV
jgi:hypothetical protein